MALLDEARLRVGQADVEHGYPRAADGDGDDDADVDSWRAKERSNRKKMKKMSRRLVCNKGNHGDAAEIEKCKSEDALSSQKEQRIQLRKSREVWIYQAKLRVL